MLDKRVGTPKIAKKIKVGGADTFSIRATTLVEGYFPGPGRQNFRQDAEYLMGKFDPGTFGNDQSYNGPGTLNQSLPNGERYQYKQIFANPRPTINKEVGIDDRQIAGYQVEQLRINPLSQYTVDPSAEIPSFFTSPQPSDFSDMVNVRQSQLEKWTADFKPNQYVGASQVPGRAAGAAESVYPQYSGEPYNPNAAVVYNNTLNSKETYNPFISQGSSSSATSEVVFSSKSYSGHFVPGKKIGNESGKDIPKIYGGNTLMPMTQSEIGFMNESAYDNNEFCVPDPAVRFANPLILQR